VLRAPKEQRQTAERVLGIYAEKCPLYRSVKGSIAVTWSLTFIPEVAAAEVGKR